MAGGANVAERAGVAWAQLSIEEIIDADPQVIILPGAHGTAFTPREVLEANAAWSQTTAVKEGNIFIVEGDLVEGFGPRIVQGLAELARILHPELFD
jgi:iron complex transport system substrate-binding protein